MKYLDMLLLRLATNAEAKFSSVFAFLKLIKGCQHTLNREIMKETAGKQDGKPNHDMLLLHQPRPIKQQRLQLLFLDIESSITG